MALLDDEAKRMLDSGEAFARRPTYHLKVGGFKDSINTDISKEFEKEGVDIQGLESLAEFDTGQDYENKRMGFLGRFKDGGAIVYGFLDFVGPNIEGRAERSSVRFSTIIWLYNKYAFAEWVPPTYKYHVKLSIDEKHYEKSVQVSQSLKPGDSDRFIIRVGVDKSSLHKFRLKAVYNNGAILISPPIVLRVFVPRSGARDMEEQTALFHSKRQADQTPSGLEGDMGQAKKQQPDYAFDVDQITTKP
jgi:hypothetical protein